MDLRLIPAILVVLLFNTLLSAWKWQLLLAADGIILSLKKLVVSYLIGTFFNLFLPSNIGGDSYRIYDVYRHSKRSASSFASVLADRLSGFVALAILSIGASIFVAQKTDQIFVLGLATLIAIALFIVIGALLLQTPVRQILKLTRLDKIPRVSNFAEQLLAVFSIYRHQPGLLIKTMLISFAFQLSVITCVYFMAVSLHVAAPFIYFCAFVPIITLMEAIPISIYGLGVRDAGYIYFFAIAGLSQIQTRALALMFVGVTVSYSLIGGLLLLIKTLRQRCRQKAVIPES